MLFHPTRRLRIRPEKFRITSKCPHGDNTPELRIECRYQLYWLPVGNPALTLAHCRAGDAKPGCDVLSFVPPGGAGADAETAAGGDGGSRTRGGAGPRGEQPILALPQEGLELISQPFTQSLPSHFSLLCNNLPLSLYWHQTAIPIPVQCTPGLEVVCQPSFLHGTHYTIVSKEWLLVKIMTIEQNLTQQNN